MDFFLSGEGCLHPGDNESTHKGNPIFFAEIGRVAQRSILEIKMNAHFTGLSFLAEMVGFECNTRTGAHGGIKKTLTGLYLAERVSPFSTVSTSDQTSTILAGEVLV